MGSTEKICAILIKQMEVLTVDMFHYEHLPMVYLPYWPTNTINMLIIGYVMGTHPPFKENVFLKFDKI